MLDTIQFYQFIRYKKKGFSLKEISLSLEQQNKVIELYGSVSDRYLSKILFVSYPKLRMNLKLMKEQGLISQYKITG